MSTPREDMLASVKEAMQPAEELGGLTGLEYILLMNDIIKEAQERIENYVLVHGEEIHV